MADVRAAGSIAVGPAQYAPPYLPGWPDRVINWVRKLPVPAWLFYLGLAVAVAVVETLIKWYDGAYPVGTLWLFHLAVALPLPYSLAVRHYINDAAGLALDSSRATLELDDRECEELRYRLTTTPARPTALLTFASLLAASMFSLIVVMPDGPGKGFTLPPYLKLATSPLAAVFDSLILASSWSTLGANLYWVVRLLRMVHIIYARYAHVDIYRVTSLYAFSGLTARVAICLLAGIYAANLVFPTFNSPSIAWQASRWSVTTLGIGIAIASFVWPLVGVHRILERQKALLLDENGAKIRAASGMTHDGLARSDLANMVPLKHAMDSLVAERGVLQGLRTWPWQADTFRWVSTAALLPVLVFLLQKLISALLGP
jgi:hypothetical protein